MQFINTFTVIFPCTIHLFVVLYRIEGLYKRLREQLVGRSHSIEKVAYNVQRSPADVINSITDQQLLQHLVHLVEEWVFILGRETYYSPVWNMSNK